MNFFTYWKLRRILSKDQIDLLVAEERKAFNDTARELIVLKARQKALKVFDMQSEDLALPQEQELPVLEIPKPPVYTIPKKDTTSEIYPPLPKSTEMAF
jgi:hypothetical protein